MAKWATGTPPKKSGRYLITLVTPFGRQVRQADRGEYPSDNWYWRLLSGSVVSNSEVVAWQKCPEPYKG